MADKFQNQFRIPSARADWWDYGWNAAYFITICTAHREHYFGEIDANPIIQLSEIGQLADKFWRSISEHFPFVKLDAFVVMPNHIHGILVIDKLDDGRESTPEPKTPGELRFRNQGKIPFHLLLGRINRWLPNMPVVFMPILNGRNDSTIILYAMMKNLAKL
jgi:REP element-mobilizing transposase RayT